MKIGMLLLTNFPPDIRVEKEIESLKNHQIHVLCTKRGSGNYEKYEKLGAISITRIFDKPMRSITNLQLFLFRKSWIWESKIKKFVKKNNLDVLHVHDLPLTGSAYKVAKNLNIKLVVDLHENYPEMLRESKKKRLLDEFTLPQIVLKLTSIKRWKNYEKRILNKVDNIIVVIEEARNRLINEINVNEKKIRVIPNYDTIRKYDYDKVKNKKITLVYSGGFGSTRDLKTIIYSINKLNSELKEKLCIKLIGGTGREYDEIQALIKSQNTQNIVKLYNFMPFEEMYKHLISSDIGMVPHRKSKHTDNTIPHKLFQYMNLGMPIISSNCTPLERIINDSRCGLIYEAENPHSLALVIEEMCKNQNERRLMSQNSKKAIVEKYNWNICENRLIELYDDLI